LKFYKSGLRKRLDLTTT